MLGAAKGMAVAGDDAAVTRQLPMPVPLTGCSPVRWWTSTSILAFCGDTSHATGVQCGTTSQSPGSQLWQVPLNGGAPTALTALNTGRQNDQDLADANAWQLPAGTFLQSYGPCGFTFASRLTPDLHTTPIKASGVPHGARVVGATADKLVLQADSLVSYDPATDTATVVLGPPVNGGRVHDAILW